MAEEGGGGEGVRQNSNRSSFYERLPIRVGLGSLMTGDWPLDREAGMTASPARAVQHQTLSFSAIAISAEGRGR